MEPQLFGQYLGIFIKKKDPDVGWVARTTLCTFEITQDKLKVFWNIFYDGISHENVLSLILCFRDVRHCCYLFQFSGYLLFRRRWQRHVFSLGYLAFKCQKSNYQDAKILLLFLLKLTQMKFVWRKKTTKRQNFSTFL